VASTRTPERKYKKQTPEGECLANAPLNGARSTSAEARWSTPLSSLGFVSFCIDQSSANTAPYSSSVIGAKSYRG
jgi:hypothetical protein